MKWNLAVFIFISFFGQISCLKCFQGAINVTAAATNPGTAIDCPASSDVACAMSYDSSSKSASFMCSKLNCTVNGVYTHESACVNASATLKNCCCYTDGCSFAFLAELKNNPLSTLNIAPTNLNMTTPKPPSIVLANETNSFNVRSLDFNGTTPKPPLIANVTNGVTTGSNISMSNLNTTTPKPPSLVMANVSIPLPSPVISANVTNVVPNNTNVTSGIAFTTAKLSSSPLKCFQGTVNTTSSSPISLTRTTCLDPFAVSCTSQNEAAIQFAVFSCSNSNCSINGRSVSESVCINVSSTQRNCCCYGDGCNTLAFSMGLPPNSTTTPLNSFNNTAPSPPPKTFTPGALKCLQGLQNTTLPLTIVPTLCTDPLAVTCRSQTDPVNKFATYSCSTSNCTINGITIKDNLCVNASSTQHNCCCYGDGCNAVLSFLNPPNANSSFNTSKPAATERATSKDAAGVCDQNGFKTLATAADSSLLTKGKFAGYLTYRSSCQQLCDKSYGLIKCTAYMYEPNNRGKCTIFQEPIESVTENPGSNVIVSTKC